jgi:hypothetical protein
METTLSFGANETRRLPRGVSAVGVVGVAGFAGSYGRAAAAAAGASRVGSTARVGESSSSLSPKKLLAAGEVMTGAALLVTA